MAMTIRMLVVLLFLSVVGTAPKVAVADDALRVPFPKNYRSFTHVKSMVIFDKKHPLYDAFGGIHHIYTNAKATKALKSKSAFPKGSVFVFDLLDTAEATGAYTEAKRKFVAVMVRNEKKYAKTAGWGWGVFLEGDPKKSGLKTLEDQKACVTCHNEVGAKHWVFTQWRP